MTRRLVAALATAILLTGCNGVSVNDEKDRTDDPSARSEVDGVETWDLTGEPSAEAFGVQDGRVAAIYRTDEPRSVRYALPGDLTLTLDTSFVEFSQVGGDSWTWSAQGPGLDSSALVDAFADVLKQGGAPTTAADAFEQQVAAAPDGSSENVKSAPVVLDDSPLRVDVTATWSPAGGNGRLDVSGAWR